MRGIQKPVAERLRRQSLLDFAGQRGFDFLVSIEREDPVAGGFLQCGILLGGESFPFFYEEFRMEGLGDLAGAIGRAGIDDDDFVRPRHALQRAREVGFLVLRDDDDGEAQADHANRKRWRREEETPSAGVKTQLSLAIRRIFHQVQERFTSGLPDDPGLAARATRVSRLGGLF